MAETFDNFMNHKRRFKYIQNTNSIDLGNGYKFVSKPNAPLTKEFNLIFEGFRYYFNPDGTIDYEKNKDKNNLGALCKFYEEMNMYGTFIYNDEQFGGVLVRFKEPLPEISTSKQFGVADEFTVVLEEVAL